MGYENIQFTKDTHFLVTGAAGFIGTNLIEALLQTGCKVSGLDNFTTGKKENLESFFDSTSFHFIEGDIRNYDTCKDACEGIDYVMHQAAMGSAPRSMKFPVLYGEINIGGTLNMLQAAAETKVKRFIYASSSSVYGDSLELPKIEGREGKTLSPYALTKVVNENYGELYYKVYGLETIGLRYFNVFGPRQDPYSPYAAAIPLFIKKLLLQESPIIYGDGEQSRDFTFIENVIEANFKACVAPHEVCGQVYNIAFGKNRTINNIYIQLCELLGRNIKPIYVPHREGDVCNSLANISKARELLKYNPDFDFDYGIKKTIDWYKVYFA